MPTRLKADRPGKPGPKPNPIRVLRDAAIEYGCAVEEFDSGEGARKELVYYWDRLRRAALSYQEFGKPLGRPVGSKTRKPKVMHE